MSKESVLAELREQAASETFVGDWVEVDQARIDEFADATGDHPYIHVDPERAKRERR
jgi:acyl dehydratase